MDIETTIREFLAFVLEGEKEVNDLGEFMTRLDKLAYVSGCIEAKFDEREYPDPPENEYREIRKIVEKRFPNLGYYNSPENICEKIPSSQMVLGDGIDDISDIVGDLKDALWYFENTSKANALWHTQESFRSHWGRHLRELQLYLHDQWW